MFGHFLNQDCNAATFHEAKMNAQTKDVAMIVYDELQKPQQLGEQVGKGGEGAVYALQTRPDVLVKLYNSERISSNSDTLKLKVQAMSSIRPKFRSFPISWPALTVYDQKQQWLGYAMPRIAGVPLRTMAHAMLYKKYSPNLNRKDIVQVLLRLLEQIQALHAQNIMIGDYNLNNFMWDPATLKVGLIDCDSYQVTVGQQSFPCLVGSPDLTPPEQHNQNFKHVTRTLQSEYFSIAIVLFMCLMLGRHPYDIQHGEDPVQNMRSGRFAYGKGNQGVPRGNWYNIWSHMPYRLKTMFIQCFTEGTQNPAQRPSIVQWQDALNIYLKEIDKGFHEVAIIPAKPKVAKQQ